MTLFWPIFPTGFAFPLVFVPLSRVTFGKLAQSELGNASGIFNLLRNLGGSIGISVATTFSLRHLQSRRAQIVHDVTGASALGISSNT
jgi:MFS transporter, DHA2 family, multidrug resistance protein